MSFVDLAADEDARSDAVAPARFRLHVGVVSLHEHHERIRDFLADERTPIYLDTSVLTWMIRVGSGAREELLGWFHRDAMAGRIHVPIWAAHELHGVLRSKGPLIDANGDLDRHRNGLQAMLRDLAFQAGSERCGGGDVVTFVERALEDLRDLGEKLRLMRRDEQWYLSAERRVVDFANERIIDGDVFSLLEEVLPSAEDRLSARVPPGYLDAGKNDNRAGDLVLWREVLRHARAGGARRLILLTNDNKEDWSFVPNRLVDYRGNEKEVDPLNGIQARLTHPMLVHEARTRDFDDVLVLDPSSLAVALDRVDRASVKALVAATHPPRLTPSAAAGIDWTRIDPPVSRRRSRRDQVVPNAPPAELGTGLTEAIRERAVPVPPLARIMNDLAGDADERLQAFETLVAPERLDGLDLGPLVAVGRALYRAAAVDNRLAGLLPGAVQSLVRPSPSVANALAAGMWADVFFDDELRPRRPPQDGPHDALFSLASDASFTPSSEAISALLKEHSMVVLARPTDAARVIDLSFSTRSPFDGQRKLLEQVRLGESELMCEVEIGSPYATVDVLGRAEGTVEQLLAAIARRFILPLDRLSPGLDPSTPLRWPPDLGFRVLLPTGGGVVDPPGPEGS